MDNVFDTSFPTAHDLDIATDIGIARERYEVFFPEVRYLARLIPEGEAPPHPGDVQPVPGMENIDDLWGENEPVNQMMGDAWENPHTTTRMDATECDKYEDKGLIHVQLNHEPTQRQLEKYGLDGQRVIIVTFLNVLLQEMGITPRFGDKFQWKDHEYVLHKIEDPSPGYWKHTSVDIYTRCVFKFKRYGS